MIQPETRFATVGNDRVAYQVVGGGDRDVLLTAGMWSHLDMQWEDAAIARFLRRLASFSRLIRFDRRGIGLSDRPSEDGHSQVEHWVEDCLAVLEATGASAPVIISMADSGPVVLQCVDRHPSRCSGLIFINTIACWGARPDYPEGHPPEVVAAFKDFFLQSWGHAEFSARYIPSQAGNATFLQWFAKYQRTIASPRAVAENLSVLEQLDSRPALSRIRVPTLVMARKHNAFTTLAQTRYIAEHVKDARFVELPGADGAAIWETPDLILDLIEEFVTGRRHGGEPERALATVLFTDIVGSTERASKLGDVTWRRLLDHHDQVVREQIGLFNGRLIESTGDGTLATFNSPDHAIDCALALHKAMTEMDLTLRAAVHFGQIELREDGRVGGISVHIGARVLALANAGEVLVSHTVQGILVGSRYSFEERGIHELKGVPGKWMVYAVGAGKQS